MFCRAYFSIFIEIYFSIYYYYFRERKEQLDSELDKEFDTLKKEEIKVKLIYDNCLSVLEDFDSCHRQFFTDIELLASTYTNAIEKVKES